MAENDLLLRIEKLEAENRRIKRLGLATLGVVALFGVAAILLLGRARSNHKIEAEEFLLEDVNHNVEGSLSMTPGGPCLKLMDMANEHNAALCSGENGSLLALVDNSQRVTVELSTALRDPSGRQADPGFSIRDADKNGVFAILNSTVGAEGPGFLLGNSAGAHISLAVDPSGPNISLRDGNKKMLWYVPVH